MLQYRNILLATDLSQSSNQVAQCAFDLAKATNATLSAVHVVEQSLVAYGGEFSIPVDFNLQQAIEQHAREALAEIGSKYNIPESLLYIGSGSVKLAVIDIAEEIGADLIVVGTHGHHGIDVLLGSRANAILHNAKCDVWVVRVKDNK